MIKLIYTFIFSLLSINCLLFGQLRAGFDVSGEFKIAVEGESDTFDAESGIVIGYDAVMQDEGELKLGVGGGFSMTPTISFEGLFASHSGKAILDLGSGYEDTTAKFTYTRISLGLVFIL